MSVSIRVGLGYDVHPFADPGATPRPLVLGGVTIDGPGFGLAGHSDADAVCHAVADALLGPAGLPDLGALFPASRRRRTATPRRSSCSATWCSAPEPPVGRS